MAKTKSGNKKQTQRGRVKVGKLNVNKDSIKDLPGKERRKIKGGQIVPVQNPKPILIGF